MRGKKYSASGMVSGILLPLGLICLFAFCTLALSLMGGTAYRSIQQDVTAEYTPVIATNYLRTKVSQNNRVGAVYLRDMDGVQVLVVETELDGQIYETRIYQYEGQLRESYVAAERDFNPRSGAALCSVESCLFTLTDDGLLEAEIVNEAGDADWLAIRLVGGAV